MQIHAAQLGLNATRGISGRPQITLWQREVFPKCCKGHAYTKDDLFLI